MSKSRNSICSLISKYPSIRKGNRPKIKVNRMTGKVKALPLIPSLEVDWRLLSIMGKGIRA